MEKQKVMLPPPFPMLDTIFAELARLQLPTNLQCDHICYRVATQARYEELKTQLAAEGELKSEAIIYGRPIATFKLYAPYVYNGHHIEALELPAPKPGTDYKEGWEHAEFVTGEPLDSFMAQHPLVAFDTRVVNKQLNPEVAVRITPQYQAKFHPTSLLDVIKVEKLLGL